MLATNYDGILQGFVWLGAMLVATLSAVLAIVLSFFRRMQRASSACGFWSLGLLVLIGLFFFFAVVPSTRTQDGCLTETRWTLWVFIIDTALVLIAHHVTSILSRRIDPTPNEPIG
jgi:hypothetical protein